MVTRAGGVQVQVDDEPETIRPRVRREPEAPSPAGRGDGPASDQGRPECRSPQRGRNMAQRIDLAGVFYADPLLLSECY